MTTCALGFNSLVRGLGGLSYPYVTLHSTRPLSQLSQRLVHTFKNSTRKPTRLAELTAYYHRGYVSSGALPARKRKNYLNPSSTELRLIFGGALLADRDALRILRSQHTIRLREALDDEGIPKIRDGFAGKARAWLDRYHPLTDEDLMKAIEQEDKEYASIGTEGLPDEELLKRAERLKIYAPIEGEEEEEQLRALKSKILSRKARQPQGAIEGMRRSIFAENAKRFKAEDEQKKVEKEERAKIEHELLVLKAQGKPMDLAVSDPTKRQMVLEIADDIEKRPQRNMRDWVQRYREIFQGRTKPKGWSEYEQQVMSDLKDIPQMSIARRLLPSLSVLLAALYFSYNLALFYTPPDTENRFLSEWTPASATLYPIIMANILIFFAWRMPPLVPSLNKYAILVPGYPYAFSILGNLVSHQSVRHLVTNMFLLYYVGTRFFNEPDVGRGVFLSTFLACGALASFGTLTNAVLLRKFYLSSQGASGALCGVIAAWAMMGGDDKRYESILLPHDWQGAGVPGWSVVAIGISIDLWLLAKSVRLGAHAVPIDTVAHLCGWASGAAIGYALRSRVRKEKRRDPMELVSEGGGNEDPVLMKPREA